MSARLPDETVTITAAPTSQSGRIRDIDVIRGFALVGVAWMNLVETTRTLMPAAVRTSLPWPALDRIVGFLGDWLVLGKAQCLFGVLFGVGFALFTERVVSRGADAGRLYARRLSFLLVLGLLHLFLLWFGDILHDYALVGFLLLLTRRWPTRALLIVGAILLLFSTEVAPLLVAGLHRLVVMAPVHEALWHALSQGDYPQLLHVGVLRAGSIYGSVWGLASRGQVAGQFLVGTWIYRKGWLQQPAHHAALMTRLGATLLPAGLLLSLLQPVVGAGLSAWPMSLRVLVHVAEDVATPMLAFGYAASLIVLCRIGARSVLLGGLAAFGRMALTNYVAQSVFYLLVFDGFGIGLIRRSGASLDLLLAIAIVVVQIAISLCWLRAFRFGPLEWLWRSATYGTWQRFRATG